MPRFLFRFLATFAILALAQAVNITETATFLTFSNPLVSFNILKSNGYIQNVVYQNTSLLGTFSGNAGQTYTDFPSAVFSLFNTTYKTYMGSDWAGIVFTDINPTGSTVQRSWWLRDEESGLHSFVRLGYHNSTGPALGPLGEVRTMFRPNPATGLWTHLITNREQYAPLPSTAALAAQVEVQDATWYIGATPNDSYVIEESEYWSKYFFSDNQTNQAHGLYADTPNGNKLGAWWVVNQKDTFFGGPSHFDLMVDGIIYNKLSTSHGGASSPNITDGFDRTWGPQFLYFNHGQNASLQTLLADAESYADPTWNAEFYDEIAPYVVNYVPTSGRGRFKGRISLPDGVKNVVAALSANGWALQDSAGDSSAYQYWEDVAADGSIDIGRVKAGTYRLTVYGDGIFGDFILDDVVVKPGSTTKLNDLSWVPESAGVELWRIGTPDRSAGEFRNGWEVDTTHPNHPHKYRIYWGAWDFVDQFPNGVNFTIGSSDIGKDWNYIHWSQFGKTYTRPGVVTEGVNIWQINFDVDVAPTADDSVGTLTIQLAGATTTSGNTGAVQDAWPFLPISSSVNNQAPFVWTITPQESGSCGVRSAISCYLLSNKFSFPGSWLRAGTNTITISLPPAAAAVYIQYDALRLELS
ncbi:galactose mutarotase-like protein [Mycena albidolilacea]|uniref:rhamnogalacturonan endolyase n=1 Tax=Mycena albidolilacea TaxID=1033008 RepID=A0AAD7A0P8_9AGAR|nr:galactose mutarotase-like protein [Mycena albidolilacea]